MVIRCPHMPRPGETVLGGEFLMNHGGKGANQAVAAAKLGGDVTFVAKVGDDIFGGETLEMLRDVSIPTPRSISRHRWKQWRMLPKWQRNKALR